MISEDGPPPLHDDDDDMTIDHLNVELLRKSMSNSCVQKTICGEGTRWRNKIALGVSMLAF